MPFSRKRQKGTQKKSVAKAILPCSRTTTAEHGFTDQRSHSRVLTESETVDEKDAGTRNSPNIMITTACDDSEPVQRVVNTISQDVERPTRQEAVGVDQVAISFSNFKITQVGKSVTIVNEVKSCCHHSRRIKHAKEINEDERLKDDSTPDETLQASSSCLAPISSTDNFKATRETESRNDSTLNEVKEEFHIFLGMQYSMPLISKHGSLRGNKCEIIMTKLEELQDNGEFESHENLACGFLQFYSQKEDPDMKGTLMIERGIAFYLANNLKKCKQLFTAAIHIGDSLVNRELLQGRALFLKAAAYRREMKFNKALKCLQRADTLLFDHEPGEDKAELYYNYGTLWLDIYSTKSSNDQGRKVLKEKAKKFFERAIENCARDERLRMQLKKKRYFNLTIAALHLDCGSKAARQTRQVPDVDIEEAKKRLDFIEYQLSDGIPLGAKIQLLKTRSDQYYRQRKPLLAREVAQEALDIAEEINMDSATVHLRARIEELDNMEALRPRDIESVVASISDSGCSGDGSSSV